MNKDQDDISGSPRLYRAGAIEEGITLPLDEKAAHYLKNVLRRADGSSLRVFNAEYGEYHAVLRYDRKDVSLEILRMARAPKAASCETHLVFAPIKKDRLDFMIEKAVELGVTHLHPVLTRRTVMRDLNGERIKKQIIEAAEQCERIGLPALSPLISFEMFLKNWPADLPLYAALERENAPFLGSLAIPDKAGFLVGPEGGFSAEEKSLLLENKKITCVSLGENILRAETAAIFGLSVLSSRMARSL